MKVLLGMRGLVGAEPTDAGTIVVATECQVDAERGNCIRVAQEGCEMVPDMLTVEQARGDANAF